ncbi:MAG TPA: hypothetical protein VHS27_11845 [Gaiellales bacterium]|nr:hypothetical protein [Gaiellales bacterium]
MIPAARSDLWSCRDCGTAYELATRSLEVGLVRLAVDGEAGFRLGSAGIESQIEPLLAPCECGGHLTRGQTPNGSATEVSQPAFGVRPRFRVETLRPLAERGWATLEASADSRLERLAKLWRSRALVLLGREDELTREQQLELRLEGRLAGLQDDIERACAAGDDDAAQAAHARYIELGTTFMRRFVLFDDGRAGTAG